VQVRGIRNEGWWRRVAQVAGHPRCLAFGHLGFMYDGGPTLMTTAAICASREFTWSPSFYRGEQYDSDLALYYLRARYYNPATGRFLSRDPEDGKATDPASLHKYLYAGGDPVNGIDPMGRESMLETGSIDAIIDSVALARRIWAIGRCISSIYMIIAKELDGLNSNNLYFWWGLAGSASGCASWAFPNLPL